MCTECLGIETVFKPLRLWRLDDKIDICRQESRRSQNCETSHFTPWKGKGRLRNVPKKKKTPLQSV